MFYFKKTKKDLPNVDLTKQHSTVELHVMRDSNVTTCQCGVDFKDGAKCEIISLNGIMLVGHVECPK